MFEHSAVIGAGGKQVSSCLCLPSQSKSEGVKVDYGLNLSTLEEMALKTRACCLSNLSFSKRTACA